MKKKLNILKQSRRFENALACFDRFLESSTVLGKCLNIYTNLKCLKKDKLETTYTLDSGIEDFVDETNVLHKKDI